MQSANLLGYIWDLRQQDFSYGLTSFDILIYIREFLKNGPIFLLAYWFYRRGWIDNFTNYGRIEEFKCQKNFGILKQCKDNLG